MPCCNSPSVQHELVFLHVFLHDFTVHYHAFLFCSGHYPSSSLLVIFLGKASVRIQNFSNFAGPELGIGDEKILHTQTDGAKRFHKVWVKGGSLVNVPWALQQGVPSCRSVQRQV